MMTPTLASSGFAAAPGRTERAAPPTAFPFAPRVEAPQCEPNALYDRRLAAIVNGVVTPKPALPPTVAVNVGNRREPFAFD